MRFLITGGVGFIGSRLSTFLYEEGHEVIIGSRSINSPPFWLSQCKYIEIDWENNSSINQACKGVDVVIHAAGMNAEDCNKNPLKALEFNGLGTARLIDNACNSQVKSFIYLSTAHVYNSPLIGKINEESCTNNKNSYATSHMAAENITLNYCRNRNIDSVVLRLSNVYGSPSNPNANCWMLLINNLCLQAVRKKKLALKTSGMQCRDFIPMQSVEQIILKLVKNGLNFYGSNILNIGSGHSQSILDVTKIIQKRCEAVLDFSPEIIIPETSLETKSKDLLYESLFIPKSSNADIMIHEIDSLLRFCKKNITNI